MSRSRDNRRRKARARRRLRKWEDRPPRFTWIVIDDPHKGPITTMTRIRTAAHFARVFGEPTDTDNVGGHFMVGVDIAKGRDMSVPVVARHAMSGDPVCVWIGEAITDPDSPPTTPDHD